MFQVYDCNGCDQSKGLKSAVLSTLYEDVANSQLSPAQSTSHVQFIRSSAEEASIPAS